MRYLGLNVITFLLLLLETTSSASTEGLISVVHENNTRTSSPEPEEHISVKRWKNADKAVRKISSMLVKSILPQAVRAAEDLNLTSSCQRGVMKFLIGIKQMKIWAFQMLDSSGKLPNGLLSGNINSLGDYDQCVDTTVPGHFQGQYCILEVSPPLPERRRFVSANGEIPEFINVTHPETVTSSFMKTAIYYYHLNFRSSICVPSTCTTEEVKRIAAKAFQLTEIDFDIKVPNCEIKVDTVIFATSEIVIMTCIGTLLFLGVTATITDVSLKLLSDEEHYQAKLSVPVKCLLCFSFYTNTLRLLKKDDSPDSIKIFHGMKVITILWVILNHTYYYINYQAFTGLLNARDIGTEVAFQFVANGFLNVETFFFISSVLVAYGVMKMKEKRLNIFLYVFRRLWRLTPPFMLVIACVYLVPYIGSGPVWKETVVDGLVKNCKSNWWTNLLYINNFIGSTEMCMQWTWYLPVDTHLYFLSLMVLIPLKSNPRLAFMMNGLLLVSGIIISAAFNVYYGLTPTAIYVHNHPEDISYFVDRGYFRSYLHCSTYCVGLTVGYILATKQNIRIPLRFNLFGWITSIVLALSVVYGVYDWNQGNVPGLLISTVYTCTNKFVWALALAWVTIVCVTGNGGIATSILSWPAFVPFGRLTYMAYLIHPIIQFVYVGSTRTLIRTDHRSMVYMYLANVVLAFMCAYGLSLLFESPFMCLEKVFFSSVTPAARKTKDNKKSSPEIIENISTYKKFSLNENNGIYAIQIKQLEVNS